MKNAQIKDFTQSPAIKRRTILKSAGALAVWTTPAVQSLLLPVHAQTSTGTITSLVVGPSNAWYETPADQPIVERRVLMISLSFRNSSAGSIDFGVAPADTLQLWTTPSVDDPGAVFSTTPAGSTVAAGETFNYQFTIDWAAVASTEAGLAFRPTSITLGTMSPSQAEVVSVSIT